MVIKTIQFQHRYEQINQWSSMKSLERDPCLYWNLAYETRGFQLDGENGGRLLDFKKKNLNSNNNIDPYLSTTMT